MLVTAAVWLALCGSAAGAGPEYGEIAEAEWQIGPPADYPEANAVVIFDRVYRSMTIPQGEFSPQLELRRHVRMKAFNKAGAEEIGNGSFGHSEKDHVSDLCAHTVTPDGQVFKVNDKDFLTRKAGSTTIVTFAFPQADSGCILEFTYKVWGGSYIRWETIPFSHEVYTLETEYVLEVPVGPQYQYRAHNLPAGTGNPVVEKLPGTDMKAKKRFTWRVQNVLPVQDEPYMGFERDYVPAVSLVLSDLSRKATVADAVEQWSTIGQLWETAVVDEYCSEPRDFKKRLREIVKGLKTDYDKSKALYSFAVSTIETRQDGFDDGFHHDNLAGLWREKFGTAGEKNLLLLAMLRSERIRAWPIMICTRDVAAFEPTWVDPLQFSHMIIFAEVEQGGIYLDATTKYNAYGTLPPVCRTDIGLLLDGDKSELVKVVTNDPPSSRIDLIVYWMDAEGNAACSTSALFTGYLCSNYGRRYETREANDFLDRDILNVDAPGYRRGSFEATLDSLGRLRVMTGYAVEGAGRRLDDHLAVNCPATMFSRNPFESERRVFPVNFNHAFTYQAIARIVGPEGSTVSQLPPDTSFAYEGLLYERQSSSEGQAAQVHSKFTVSRPLFEVDEYMMVRLFFQRVESALGEQVVFTTAKEGL